MVFLQVIAAASKPPEVDPFLQDYMDDMDQNLILCRFSHGTSVSDYYLAPQEHWQAAQVLVLTSEREKLSLQSHLNYSYTRATLTRAAS